MCINIEILLGTNAISASPNIVDEGLNQTTETLTVYFTWHNSILIHSWTMKSLTNAALAAENDDNYLDAERRFIEAFGAEPVLKPA